MNSLKLQKFELRPNNSRSQKKLLCDNNDMTEPHDH